MTQALAAADLAASARQLAGQVAFVTGASRGMGRAIALRFVLKGTPLAQDTTLAPARA
ncbi:hypothetical protein [Chitinolyticbacter albus]|uniref:hypothetical protein n=1 Tax=Chitinolyticbacter albus TaxID=2961951 RepID=UPI00210B322D|nr:hypothetical protein [Chitinolyticbacter albus]